MIITYNLKDDEDFKTEVKAMVKEVIKGLAREETQSLIEKTIQLTVEKQMAEFTKKENFEYRFTRALQAQIASTFTLSYGRAPDYVKNLVTEHIQQELPKVMKAAIDIKEIKKEVLSIVRKQITSLEE